MNNLTLAQKQYLETVSEDGGEVLTIAYNPAQVSYDPEAAAKASGFTEYYREDTTNLVEVIYTK